jgi:glucokinase
MSSEPPLDRLAFPVLVADIGGTNARFAVLEDADTDLRAFPFVPTAGFAGPIEAIASLGLDAAGLRPRSAVIAIAAPVTGDEMHLTNCPWTIAPNDMIARLGLGDVVVINDFEALALSLPSLAGDDLLPIGGGIALPNHAMTVIGPGTGLGVATMIRAAGLWVPVPGEGGHVSLGPETDRDYAIWPHVEKIDGRVSAEQVLSGGGILRLARAVAMADGIRCSFDSPEAVTGAAEAGDPLATETLATFARALGRVAGDFALASLARGGVYIAGGVSLKVRRFLTDGSFRAAFENKAPHSALVGSIPTWLIQHPRPALVGLGAYARAPQDFALETDGRRWRG